MEAGTCFQPCFLIKQRQKSNLQRPASVKHKPSSFQSLLKFWRIEMSLAASTTPRTVFCGICIFLPCNGHGHKIHLYACAFGGQQEVTSFLSNRKDSAAMSKFCKDVPPHDHKEWGYNIQNKCFKTSKEAEYPVKMCRQYSDMSITWPTLTCTLQFQCA